MRIPGHNFILSIAAGSRHSAVITEGTQQLYTFGQAHHGQLGLGENYNDKVFEPRRVELPKGLAAQQVAPGDTHTLLLTADGQLMSTGSNDKYQLGIDHEQRSLRLFKF